MIKRHKRSKPTSAIPQQKLAKTYYPFLDGFRGLAILMVLAHHARQGFDLDHWLVNNPSVLNWIYLSVRKTFGIDLTNFYLGMQEVIHKAKGILGVEIFLVISGFLITAIVLRSHVTKEFIGRFYQRRFLKIYPCYLILVLFTLWFFAGNKHIPVAETMPSLLLMQNYVAPNTFLAHTWTLVILEQFYFFCPLIIFAVYSLVTLPQQRRNILIFLCALAMAIGPIVRWYYLTSGQTFFNWPFQAATPYWTTFYHVDSIAFGCLLALLEPYWSQWKKSLAWGIGLWLIGAVSYFYLFFVWDWSYYWGNKFFYVLGYLSTGALILAAHHGVSVLTRFKFFQWMGRNSYGIYLWHYIVLLFWQDGLEIVAPTILVLGYLITTTAIGVLSTKTLERYFLRLREQLAPSIGKKACQS